jgi:hypothetical protein
MFFADLFVIKYARTHRACGLTRGTTAKKLEQASKQQEHLVFNSQHKLLKGNH